MRSGPEDESADPVGDGHSDADLANNVVTQQPGRPNPEPDVPSPVVPDQPADDETDEGQESERHPARRAPGSTDPAV